MVVEASQPVTGEENYPLRHHRRTRPNFLEVDGAFVSDGEVVHLRLPVEAEFTRARVLATYMGDDRTSLKHAVAAHGVVEALGHVRVEVAQVRDAVAALDERHGALHQGLAQDDEGQQQAQAEEDDRKMPAAASGGGAGSPTKGSSPGNNDRDRYGKGNRWSTDTNAAASKVVRASPGGPRSSFGGTRPSGGQLPSSGGCWWPVVVLVGSPWVPLGVHWCPLVSRGDPWRRLALLVRLVLLVRWSTLPSR